MAGFEPNVYQARRAVLKEKVGTGQVLLIGNQETGINYRDNCYHFRQDSTMLYYTGIDQPGVHILIDIDAGNEIIYGHESTIDDIVWTGPLPSLSEIANDAGMKSCKPLSALKGDLHKNALFLPPYRAEHNLLLGELLDIHPAEVENRASLQLIKAIISQRNIKEDREVQELDEAVRFSYYMHLAVMNGSGPGMREHDLVGIARKTSSRHNVSFSYPAILTKRGQVLHNHNHDGMLTNGDMVLFDGGCESHKYYAGDITRTFPVNGRWSPLQKDLYDVVYDAYYQSVEALKPGILFKDIHLLACRALSSGLKDLGFMKGNIDDAVLNGAHTMFFQCGLGHMIGLDVHDMENLGEHLVGYGEGIEKSTDFGLKSLRLGRALEEGIALTVEPGIYIIPELIELRKSQGLYKDFINYTFLEKYSNFGGIRIEDNFVITQEGSQMLGDDIFIPGTSDEVEEYLNQ